ncbi:L-serine ammonia-lyase, iron-sulfur-dependent, subunit alpha [Desulforhopalus singaporensis]|uniref:L-serine dehydratase n=1 Tax=Desulforhopalus singaporensis TaxID=91360 RepID=A0A1H0N7B6_9BACT|nr:L-serine ammonia-lyase, iron-sulfur-dependent, subunit alpha [Desulforhopalus singaporensis]SDO88538.1 L-serine dehydratase [Desulforhopalus singaporensis]
MKKIEQNVEQRGLEFGALTLGDCIDIAVETKCRVSDVIICEAMVQTGLDREQVDHQLINSFGHNFKALATGLESGTSFLFGSVASEMIRPDSSKIVEDDLINKMIIYTLAAQVGNHSVGLQPCAGTGDSCPYAGFMRAVMEDFSHQDCVRSAAVLLKIGTMFRVGKTSTGCNMEGFGAGSAATAGAFVELFGGTPEAVGRAVVLAVSPTIGNPCTPRVMVPGLCATHIGGAIMNGKLASHLAMHTGIPVNVPVDVMIAMAAAVHPLSAKHIVPEVVRHMEPYFRTNDAVEAYVDDAVKSEESQRKARVHETAIETMRDMARRANPIVKPFGTAVVGGSSQAVGSPTNTGRLAHFLAKGKITKVVIDLYPELFARRGINVPGIVMGAVYGASTADGLMYKEVMDRIRRDGIEIEINQVKEYQMQRVTVVASEQSSVVDARNRGGGRLAVVQVEPDLKRCLELAKSLDIEIVQ